MLLLQHAAPAAGHAAGAVAFEPVLPWLIVVLPLLGFALNGVLSIIAARRALPKLPPVGDPYYDHAHEPEPGRAHADAHEYALASGGLAPEASEQEGMDPGTRPNPVDAAAAEHAREAPRGAHAHDGHHAHDTHHAGGVDDDHDAHDHAPAGP